MELLGVRVKRAMMALAAARRARSAAALAGTAERGGVTGAEECHPIPGCVSLGAR